MRSSNIMLHTLITCALLCIFPLTLYTQDEYIPKANELFNQQRYNEAREMYEQALDNGENKAIIYFALGNLNYAQSNIAQALRYYRDVTKVAPLFPTAYLNIAKIYYQYNEFDNALTYFLEAGTVEPYNADIDMLIADTYRTIDMYDKALKYYRAAQQKSPDDASTFSAEAQMHLTFQNYEAALNVTRRGIANNPQAVSLYEIEGDIYNMRGNVFKSAAAYQSALARATNQNEQYYLNSRVAQVFYDSGYEVLAFEYYKRALEIKPDNANLMEYLGYMYAEAQRFEEAFEFYTMLYERDKKEGQASMRDLLSLAYNKEREEIIKNILTFYEKNNLSDEVYSKVIRMYQE